jgi:hypothetical protein
MSTGLWKFFFSSEFARPGIRLAHGKTRTDRQVGRGLRTRTPPSEFARGTRTWKKISRVG